MKNLKHLPSVLSIAFVLACFNVLVLAQSNDQFANVTSLGSSVRFDVGAPHASVTLTVTGPDGIAFSKEFKSGNSAEFKLNDSKGERLPDGIYTYELRVAPTLSGETKAALNAARENGNEAEIARDLRKKGAVPQPLVQSGNFMISGGSVILAGATEPGVKQARAVVPEPASTQAAQAVSTGRVNFKVQRHHPRFMVFDQVIPDDLIVQGSICAGLDCVNNENFGFDTIRLKENNTRIQFDESCRNRSFRC